MKKKQPERQKGIGRRQFLPVLGTGLLLPLLPVRASVSKPADGEDQYHTLLKPDGTVVKVPKATVENARVVNKSLSNKSMLDWLEKKDKI